MRKKMLVPILTLAALGICAGLGYSFTRNSFKAPAFVLECRDRISTFRFDRNAERSSYYMCVDRRAKLFLDHDYTETKDLSKAFLTLLTAVLVASITFSEKIVDINHSGWRSRGLMICSWILLFAAIVACGTGLALMSTGAGYAVYYPYLNYRQLETTAIRLFISAGILFGGGLIFLLAAGIVSLTERSSATNNVGAIAPAA